jgi:hypothetical protein
MRTPTLRALLVLCLAALPIVTTVAIADAVPTKAEVCKSFTKNGKNVAFPKSGFQWLG